MIVQILIRQPDINQATGTEDMNAEVREEALCKHTRFY